MALAALPRDALRVVSEFLTTRDQAGVWTAWRTALPLRQKALEKEAQIEIVYLDAYTEIHRRYPRADSRHRVDALLLAEYAALKTQAVTPDLVLRLCQLGNRLYNAYRYDDILDTDNADLAIKLIARETRRLTPARYTMRMGDNAASKFLIGSFTYVSKGTLSPDGTFLPDEPPQETFRTEGCGCGCYTTIHGHTLFPPARCLASSPSFPETA